MPRISIVDILQDPVDDDIDALGHQAESRIETAMRQVKNACQLGPRDPRTHHEYEKIGDWGDYSFYRKYAGKDSYRLIFAVYGEQMTLIAVEEKDDTGTYNIGRYQDRMEDHTNEF